jgi:activating signal cointegrator 1
MDLRTWSTTHRGPLAIYASLEVEKDACKLHGVDVKTLTTGAVIGIVDLVEVIPLTKKSYDENQKKHLAGRNYREGLYGWVVKNPRLLDMPQVTKGRLHLFDVTINEVESQLGPIVTSTAPVRKNEATHPPAEFELRVVPTSENQYRLAFTQNLVEASPNQPMQYHFSVPKTRVEVELGGDVLKSIADQIIEALRQNGYKPTDLNVSRTTPFHLDETTGVRLGLIFLAVKRISKSSRVEAISQGIRQMTNEELYYWYSKCTGGPHAERAQVALRTLLADE